MTWPLVLLAIGLCAVGNALIEWMLTWRKR